MSAQQELELARRQEYYYRSAERRAYLDGDGEMARYFAAQAQRFAERAAKLAKAGAA